MNKFDENCLINLYKDLLGENPMKIVKLGVSGSNRRYYRLYGEKNLIGTIGDNVAENMSFINLSRLFKENGVNVPDVLKTNSTMTAYLQEDFGDESLFELIQKYDLSYLKDVIRKSFAQLVKVQLIPLSEFDTLCYAEPFGRRRVIWDLNYFKYNFVKISGVDFDESLLEDDFESLTEMILERGKATDGFMYRDFQSRNILIKEGEPRLIDFQGGSQGPGIYDVVSFLWQAKANFPEEFRKEMLEYYASLRSIPLKEVVKDGKIFAFFRTLQVLGAYGFRGLIEKKAHFITSIPKALNNLKCLLDEGLVDDYPELKKICGELVDLPRFKRDCDNNILEVTVLSFSYKSGYPEDLTGNGGGFMFDCRAMHNPGRYEEYKQLTGRDKPVIDFLEERGEVQEFLVSAENLVFKAVERYINRGFTSLQVGFGCTGGQHRSVYCAESMAKRLKSQFPMIKVRLIHREQGIEEIY